MALVVAHTYVGADSSISVSASLLEFAADPGTSFDEVVTVNNMGSAPAQITVTVDQIPGGPPSISAASWVVVDPREFDLDPGKSNQVTISIDIPGDAQPGGRHAVILFSSAKDQTKAKIILTVRGDGLSLQARLDKLIPVALGPGRIGFRAELVNTGNVHIVASGEVQLEDPMGSEVGRLTLPNTMPVLPSDTESFSFIGSAEVPEGDYQAFGNLDYSWTQEQREAARVDVDDWGQREASNIILFNSVPKLRVAQLRMGISGESDVVFDLSLENYGDVEIAPAGIIDVANKAGESLIVLN